MSEQDASEMPGVLWRAIPLDIRLLLMLHTSLSDGMTGLQAVACAEGRTIPDKWQDLFPKPD
jgi:hypothetical protein